MIKTKRIIALALSIVVSCSFTSISHASGNDISNTNNNSGAAVFTVEKESLDAKIEAYDIPLEVAEYIEKVFSDNPNADVTVFAPGSEISPSASGGSWGATRTYKGYTLKDWNVHTANAFNMTSIKTGSLAYKFSSELLIYLGGTLLDSVIPFGSAGITLVQFLNGSGATVYPGSGDRASVAPKFTTDAKFTYVNIGGEYLLGARSYKSVLQTIAWYYYCDATHTQTSKIASYNKTFKTKSFNNPDSKAIVWVSSGGYLEEPIRIRIGAKDFVLD